MLDLWELLGALTNLSGPDNRRESGLYLAIFGLLLTVIFGGVFIAEASASSAPLLATYLALPVWIRWGTPAGLLIMLVGATVYLADARIEQSLHRRIGKRPRVE